MGCAGPTTPFGGLNGFGKLVEVIKEKTGAGTHNPVITFEPHHQLFHDKATLDIVIEDPKGVPRDHRLVLIYNGLDVTSTFLAHSERIYMDLRHNRMKLTMKNFRLPPGREHDIRLAYYREVDSEAIVANYEPPICPAFEHERRLASVPRFSASPRLVEWIDIHSREEKLNPYYVAGLIAQESSFDPLAVSQGKALGLTQITYLGEGEVVKENPTWPRYPSINDMSALELKLAVLNGEVNARNEWRLNPELSVKGGVSYLAYLSNYWKREERKALLEKSVGSSEQVLSEVMLASYNSGAARVARALDRRGADWLQDEELSEAKTYVRRVNSYCDHFTRGRE
jgi:hypothetical protein